MKKSSVITEFIKPTTIQSCIIVSGIKEFLRTTSHTYILDNPRSVSALYANMCIFILNSNINGIHRKYKTVNDVKAGIKKYLSISNGAEFAAFMIDNKTKLMVAKVSFKAIRLPKAKKCTHTAYKTHHGLNMERSVAVRSKYGDTPVMFYKLKGSMSSTDNKEVNEIKMQYKYDTGCKYYEVRPILLSTWMELPPNKQIATVDTEVVEKQVFER